MSSPSGSAAPLLSVVIITFNQEDFVRQTLESVLEQQTDFPFEVIVADDASTDRTPQIIDEIARAHPTVVRPVLREANVGIHPNLIDALGRARGTYIALCEGDDYWTDRAKLAKQVAYLEARPGTGLCFHPVRVTWTDSSQPDDEFPTAEHIAGLSLDGLLAGNFIQTNSVVYRRLPRYDDIPDVMPLDWYLHIRHAMAGEIGMLPDVMAVYRRHPGGIWFDSTTDHDKFWSAQGEGHAALCEALLDLFGTDPARRALISETAARVLGELGRIDSSPPADSPLLEVIVRHPRWAELAVGRHVALSDQTSQELAAAREETIRLSAVLEQTEQHVANLEEISQAQGERIGKQRERIQKQAARIERLKARLEERAAELDDARGRLPRERLRRQARRLIGGAPDRSPQ